MEFSKSIELSDKKQVVGELQLKCSVVDNAAIISYSDTFSTQGTKSGPSFFYVLADIRSEYGSKGMVLLCKGAQESVFPGGLASDSSFGELAYEILSVDDEPAVVNIFDRISMSEIETVVGLNEQKNKRRDVLRNKKATGR